MVPPLLFNHCLRYISKTLISAALIYGIGALSAAASPKTRTHLPTSSIAVSDDALSTFFNPSGLGTGRGLNLYYLRTYQSDWAGDDAFFLAVPNGGFGVEFATANADTTFTRYTLSGGRASGALTLLGHKLQLDQFGRANLRYVPFRLPWTNVPTALPLNWRNGARPQSA